ncbi:hypothetical protein ACS0TY_026149 [Phlomoides rotata]
MAPTSESTTTDTAQVTIVTKSPAPPTIVPTTAHYHLPIKLSHSNYPSWRTHLLALRRGHALLGFIDGKSPCPNLVADGSNAATITT